MQYFSNYNCILFIFMVILSAVVGRLSLIQRKYTGWYEKFVNISKLIYLVENAAIFFLTVVFCFLLVFFNPDETHQALSVILIMFMVYVVEVVFFFSLPTIKLWLLRLWGKIKSLINGSDAQEPAEQESDTEEDSANEAPSENDITPRSLLLRFLSFFSVALGILVVISILLALFVLTTNEHIISEKILWIWESISNNALKVCCYNLLLPSFLLLMTSSTGAFLAVSGMKYDDPYTSSKHQREQRHIEAITQRIRKR